MTSGDPSAPTASTEELDSFQTVHFLPKGATMHAETDSTVFVERGKDKFYGLIQVSAKPPSFHLSKRSQIDLYEDFIFACPTSKPEDSDLSDVSLFRNASVLFDAPALKNRGLSLSLKPPTLQSDVPFNLVERRFLPLIVKWLQPTASEVKLEELRLLPVNAKIKQAILQKKNPPQLPRL